MTNNIATVQPLSIASQAPAIETTSRTEANRAKSIEAMEMGFTCDKVQAQNSWVTRAAHTIQTTPYLPLNATKMGLQKLQSGGFIPQAIPVGGGTGCGAGCAAGAIAGALLGTGAAIPMVVIGVLKCLNKQFDHVNEAGKQDLGQAIPLIVVGAFMPELCAAFFAALCGAVGGCVK